MSDPTSSADELRAQQDALKALQEEYTSLKLSGPRGFFALNDMLHERAMFVKDEAGLKLVRSILSDLRQMEGKPRPTNKPKRNTESGAEMFAAQLLDQLPLSLESDVLGYVHCKEQTFVSLEEKKAENVATLARILTPAMAVPSMFNKNFSLSESRAAWDELQALTRGHADALYSGRPADNPVFVDGDTLLVAAVRLGSLPHVKAVLFADDAPGSPAATSSPALSKDATLRILRGQNSLGHNALHAAAANGNQEIFEYIVKLERDLVRELSKEGFSGSVGEPMLACTDTLGRVPLTYACWWAHAPLVRVFYQLHAPVLGMHPMEGGEMNRSLADIFGKAAVSYAAAGFCQHFAPYVQSLADGSAMKHGANGVDIFIAHATAFNGVHDEDYFSRKSAVEYECNGLILTTGLTAVDGLQSIVMAVPAALLVNPGKALFSLFG